MNRHPITRSPDHRITRFAEALCTAFLVASALYFAGHILAAWLRGSFEVCR